MSIDPKAEILNALTRAEAFRDLVIKSRDHGERQVYERIVELHMEIAETLEALLDH